MIDAVGDAPPTVRSRAELPVALVAMPFGPAHTPSIQIALLATIARAAGFPARTFHLTLELAHEIGSDVYEAVGLARGHLLGEWLFSRAAFGDAAPDDEAYLARVELTRGDRRLEQVPMSRAELVALKHRVIPRFLERMLEEIPWGDYRVVGFTSTFQQSASSFALAAAIKRRYPHVVTVFGGANFEPEMGQELTRTVPCIDAAVVGEADTAFVELLDAIRLGRDPATVPGVIVRRDGEVTRLVPQVPVSSLDVLPTPEYDEYFERAGRLGLLPSAGMTVGLPYESSRGCWWGQKHLCTFCGLNLGGAAYRTKSPARVVAEVEELGARHPGVHLVAADNIVDMSYFRTVFPALAERRRSPKLFLEVKSNLTRVQLQTLADAGVTGLQPGIESLSTHVLERMRKGVTAAQNVNTLRWARYLGIGVLWNLLWGFPGETADDYGELAGLMPRLWHLTPPESAGPLKLMRFSPMFEDRAKFPTRYVRPDPAYALVYPAAMALDKVAFVFEHDFAERLPDDAYEPTRRAVDAWTVAWKQPRAPRLVYWPFTDFVRIEDARAPGETVVHVLEGDAASVYLACADYPRSARAAASRAGLPEARAVSVLEDLVARGLTMRDGASYLSLAIPAARRRFAEREGRVSLSLAP